VFDGVRADGQAQGRLVQFRHRHDGVRDRVGIAERLGRQRGEVGEELSDGRQVDVVRGDDVEAGGELGGVGARFDDGDLDTGGGPVRGRGPR